MNRRTGTCARCERTVPIKGRGLCSPCYGWAVRSGAVDNYPRTVQNRADDVAQRVDDGWSDERIADDLGMTLNAVKLVRQRVRPSERAGGGSAWERLYVAPPPDDVPCASALPWLFDIDASPYSQIITWRAGAPRHPAPHVRDRLRIALRYCADCPLATREWCVSSVRPQESKATIVAGGVVWVGGRPSWTVEDQARYEAAEAVAS